MSMFVDFNVGRYEFDVQCCCAYSIINSILLVFISSAYIYIATVKTLHALLIPGHTGVFQDC
jgi:hypothetical protein